MNGATLCAVQVWWRAQAAAYIVRPNAPTMAAVTAMRMNASITHVWQAGLWPAVLAKTSQGPDQAYFMRPRARQKRPKP